MLTHCILDGTGEFLDAWLLLVEKMVNTKNILESPHTLPAKSTQPGFVSFDPLQYLIKTQKVCDLFLQIVVQNRSVFVLINVKENETEAQNVRGFISGKFSCCNESLEQKTSEGVWW